MCRGLAGLDEAVEQMLAAPKRLLVFVFGEKGGGGKKKQAPSSFLPLVVLVEERRKTSRPFLVTPRVFCCFSRVHPTQRNLPRNEAAKEQERSKQRSNGRGFFVSSERKVDSSLAFISSSFGVFQQKQ